MEKLDVNQLYGMYNDYSNRLFYKKTQLAEAKKTNEELVDLTKNLNEVKELRAEIENNITAYKTLIKVTKAEDLNYKNRRLAFIEENLDNYIDLIFPNEGFKAKINCGVKYNTERAVLTLQNKVGRISKPKRLEGKLCRQLINFSATKVISECFNLNKLYLDEAFTASSRENLTKISTIVKSAIDSGAQIILIEQEDGVYKDLPRREIHISKNPLTLETSVLYNKDY